MPAQFRGARLWLSCVAVLFSARASAQTQVTTPNVINVSGPTQVTVDGQTFVNHGIVGMGRIPAGTPDFNGDAIGGFSGMEIDLSTWRKTPNGYTGTLFGLPDRGPNGIGNVDFSDYPARLNIYSMLFAPYTGAAVLPASSSSQNQLALTQAGGFVFRDFNGRVTTGLEPQRGAAGVIVQQGVPLPGQTSGSAAGKISMDAEALRFLRDGSFYVSDEYGDNVYYFDAGGRLQGVIGPPAALLPRDASGNIAYSGDPATGRRPNQGLEGLAITPDGKKLVTLAQSATMQDSTGSQQTRTNTRLMIYDISSTKTPGAPIADYVLQLPVFTLAGNGNAPNRTAAQSEMLALNDTQFLVLSRDGLGLGTATGNPVFKSVLLVDVGGATNIAGTPFETGTAPISPGGVLTSSITPVRQFELVNMLNATQIGRFGGNLNNAAPTLLTLAEKWEGMTLAPVLEEGAPQDFFLFVGNDNDFLSTTCRVNGEDCSQSVDSDAHVMIFRLTLPTYVDPEYLASMETSGPLAIGLLAQSATDVAAAHLDNIAAHVDAARRTGYAPGRFSVWASGLYGSNHWSDFQTIGATTTGGVRGTFGVDVGVTRRVAVGAAIGYGESNASTGIGFRADTAGFSFGPTVRYSDAHLVVDAAYAHGTYDVKDITRPAAYGLTAGGATTSASDAVQVEAAYTFGTRAARLSPLFRYRYVRNDFGAYTEAGAAGGNVAVPALVVANTFGVFGAEGTFDWHALTPVFHAAYHVGTWDGGNRVSLKLASATAAMATQSVTVPLLDEDFVSLGAGVQKAFGRGLWHAGYTAEIGRVDRVSHVVRAGLGFGF